ncbi:hypothetical protein SLH46_03045 [Draconibacterium sp. IB214405]|uniref:Spy/CpxP family protein refolding chaperone n=1 Tax=Draconibacterium sp. IB214405 TaxID=3097352 RepID=UPI002A0BFFC7|nr:hypothetical protein [Draconibacterium sp. IB214405]MDX8338144.1 hypothetical protein [Draconibacterium sp. IB214405]
MKTSKLINVAWVFFALVLTTTTVFAQRGRRANTVQNNQNLPCLTQISNLTEEQETSIQELEANHQKTMEELREQRRSTTNAVEKSELRTAMLKNVETHRGEVRNLLTADQQKQYDQLQSTAGYGPNQNVRRGQGKSRGNFSRGNGGQVAYANNNGRGNRGNWSNGNFQNNTRRGVNCRRTAGI